MASPYRTSDRIGRIRLYQGMRVTVTLEQVQCFATEDQQPEEDELYVHASVFTRGQPGTRRRTTIGSMRPGGVVHPNARVIDNETFTPGRSYIELIAWDEDGVSEETFRRVQEGAIRAKNPIGGMLVMGVLGLIDLLDPDDYLGAHLYRLDMPPIVVSAGVPAIAPPYVQGLVQTFRANLDGADYLLTYRHAYAW